MHKGGISLLIFSVAVASGVLSICSVGSASVSVSKFNRLSPIRRMQLAVAAAAARANALRNVTFSAAGDSVTMRGSRPTSNRWISTLLEFRAVGRTFWLHLQTKLEPQGRFWTNFYTNWNGHVERGISYEPSFKKVAECVTSGQPYNFRHNACMDMLGLRVDTPLYDTTLSRYLRRALKNKWQHYRAWEERSGSGSYLVVRVFDGGGKANYQNTREFWMSVQKGFMLWRIRDKFVSMGRLIGTCNYQVLAAAKRAGVWFPTRLQRVTKNIAIPGLRALTTYRLTEFETGRVTRAMLKLKFPRNSLRLNLIRMRCVFVNKDGVRSPRPLYIPQVGKVLNPSTSHAAAPAEASRGTGSKPTGTAQKNSGLSFLSTVGHCSVRRAAESVEKIFPFVNRSGTIVRIDKITTSCHCTTAVASQAIVRPGARGYIRVKVRLKGLPDKFSRLITVYDTVGKSAFPSRQRLKLLVVKG